MCVLSSILTNFKKKLSNSRKIKEPYSEQAICNYESYNSGIIFNFADFGYRLSLFFQRLSKFQAGQIIRNFEKIENSFSTNNCLKQLFFYILKKIQENINILSNTEPNYLIFDFPFFNFCYQNERLGRKNIFEIEDYFFVYIQFEINDGGKYIFILNKFYYIR